MMVYPCFEMRTSKFSLMNKILLHKTAYKASTLSRSSFLPIFILSYVLSLEWLHAAIPSSHRVFFFYFWAQYGRIQDFFFQNLVKWTQNVGEDFIPCSICIKCYLFKIIFEIRSMLSLKSFLKIILKLSLKSSLESCYAIFKIIFKIF